MDEPTLLYYVYLPKEHLYKIGITRERLGVKKRFSGECIEVVRTWRFPNRSAVFTIEADIIKEFEEYSYKLDIEGEVTPIIENKETYHGLDGLRYICLAIGKNTATTSNGFLSVSGESMLNAF